LKPSPPANTRTLVCQPTFVRLAAVVVLFNVGYSTFQFLFNFYLAARGLNEARMGLLTSAMVLGGMAGALPAARLAGRWGTARTLGFALAGTGAVLLMRLMAAPLWVEWLLAFGSGAFLCGWTVLIFPLIAAHVKAEEQTRAFQLLYGLATGSCCAGAMLGGQLPQLFKQCWPALAEANRERVVLLLAAVLVMSAGCFLPQAAEAKMADKNTTRFRPSSRLIALLAVSAAWALLLGAFNPFAGIYFQQQFQMGIATIGNYFFLVQILVALGLLAAGLRVGQRLSPTMQFVLLQALVAGAFLLLGSHRMRTAQLAYLGFMLAQQLAQPILQTLLFAAGPVPHRNQIAGWNGLGTALMQALAAQAMGLLWVRVGCAPLLLALAAAAALLAAIQCVLQLHTGWRTKLTQSINPA